MDVLILDGNSAIGVNVRDKFDLFKAFDQIESSHKLDFLLEKDLLSFMRAQQVLIHHLIQVPWAKDNYCLPEPDFSTQIVICIRYSLMIHIVFISVWKNRG